MSRNFTVLGAGIVGVCTALALQREGWTVTLVDRDDPGHGCSFGNAGIIHTGGCVPLARPGIVGAVPGMLLDPEGPLVIRWRHLPRLVPWLARMAAASRRGRVEQSSKALAPLALAARAAYQPLLKEAGAEDLMRARGELYVYRTRASFDAASWEMDVRRRFGVPVEELDSKSLREMEPALAADFQHAHYQPASAFVTSPLRLVESLFSLFLKNGGKYARAQVRNARANALETSNGDMEFENLVICAGAFSRKFAAGYGADVPLETWRGYHIMAAGGPRINGVIVDGDLHFAVTPMEEGLRVAGLIELASLEAPPNYARADLFLKLARKLIPAFPTQATSRWMGHRPGMPDTVPVIGRSPAQRNVWFNFGHGMLGLTFGPITGQLLADMAAGRTSAIDPAPYRAERFLSPWTL